MKACKYINSTIIFTENGATPCYSSFSDNAPEYVLDIDNQNFSFIKQKFEIVENINNSKEYYCSKCYHFQEFQKIEEKYKLIIFKFWNNEKPKYDVVKTIKNLYDNDLIDKENLTVEFQTGSILASKNFEETLKLFKENGYKKISFFTNNVIYSPIIESILAEGKGNLSIIFEYQNNNSDNELKKHTKTLRSYMSSALDKMAITTYYNLSQGINDNIVNAKYFIDFMYQLGINRIGLSLEQPIIKKWLNTDLPLIDCPKDIPDTVLFFFKYSRQFNFYLDMTYEEQNIVLKKMFKTHKRKNLKNKIKYFFARLLFISRG